MNKPKISPNFTIDDIHKIREYNHEVTKSMSVKERKEYYNSKAEEMKAEIAKLKNSNQANSSESINADYSDEAIAL